MDDFGVTNADYFEDMYHDIHPHKTGTRLVPNWVKFKPVRLIECKILDILVFVDTAGVTHVTLYDKREDYKFFVNRFPDINSNVCRSQSIASFYGEVVRLFRINTHLEGFFDNVSEVMAYLIKNKNYPEEELFAVFSHFQNTQVFNPRD